MTHRGTPSVVVALLFLSLSAASAARQAGPPVWNNPPTRPTAGVEHQTFHSASMDTDVGYSILLPPAFVGELIPQIDEAYRSVDDRQSRAIEGMSMGGVGALVLGMKHSDLFGSVVAYAPALLDVQETADGTLTLARAGGTHEAGNPPPPTALRTAIFQRMFDGRPEAWRRHSPWELLRSGAAGLRQRLPIRIVIGTVDGLYNANMLFHEMLLEHGYEHELEIIEGVSHNIRALYAAAGLEGLSFHAGHGGWR